MEGSTSSLNDGYVAYGTGYDPFFIFPNGVGKKLPKAKYMAKLSLPLF